MKFKIWLAAESIFLACSLAMLGAAFAHADSNSYLAYLRDNHVNTAFLSDAGKVQVGLNMCRMMQSGMTIDQIAATPSIEDLRGMAVGAKRELCP